MASLTGSEVRLAELAASMSLATDLGLGQPMEHVLRSSVRGLRIAEDLELGEVERAVVYYVALLCARRSGGAGSTPARSTPYSARRGTTLPAAARVRPGLRQREVEVLALLARGLSNKAIAARLVVLPKTVGDHIDHIYRKIGCSTRAAASLFAMQHGLLPELQQSTSSPRRPACCDRADASRSPTSSASGD